MARFYANLEMQFLFQQIQIENGDISASIVRFVFTQLNVICNIDITSILSGYNVE